MKKTKVSLKFPGQFAAYINNINSLEFEGDRMADLVAELDAIYGNIQERLFDTEGRVKPYINIFIGKKNIESLQGLESVVPDGERISLLLSRAGG